MRIARFNGGRIGVVIDSELRDITELVGADGEAWPPVAPLRMIRDWSVGPAPSLSDVAIRAAAPLPLAQVKLETPIPWPNKLIAIPVNYRAHAVEMSSPAISVNGGFFMLSNSSLSGPEDPVVLPDLPGRQIHHEAELAVIIGKGGRHISRESALDHVFGYSCLLDITVRGKQERAIRKSYDTFTPVGPWITTADDVGSPDDLQITLQVNGETRQSANTKDMILAVDELIEMCSAVMTLHPGDIIATGTCEGVAPISDGDVIDIDIARVGRMSVQVNQGSGGSNCAIPYEIA